MKQFKLIDKLIGWLVFAIAAFVYCSTVEPTASFWDCPEFITTAYKFEVGHPPGAPFFMVMGNLFSQLAGSPARVAFWVNIMNALFSAFCILFLFWSITHLTRKLVAPKGIVATMGQTITIEASGLVGALIYTFSDTFWFSAVEGEVYAFSSLFTALVVWLMLKWEENADQPHSDRWLVLIAYLTGLSVGVHLLNLLCLPALVLIFYYRKFPNANLKGSIAALLLSFVLIAVVLYGIVPGIVKVGGWFELLAVNKLHLPYNTGLFLYIIALVSVIIWAVWESVKQRNRMLMVISYCLTVGLLGIPFYGHGTNSYIIAVIVLALLAYALILRLKNGYWVSPRLINTSLLCMMMIFIGYSSYAIIMIRSAANPPMDQNSPEDIFTLGTYLNREQYGDRPLFYGQSYGSERSIKKVGMNYEYDYTKGEDVYIRNPRTKGNTRDEYIVAYSKKNYKYDQNMLFPRMYSDRPEHIQAYQDWTGGITGKTYTYPEDDPRKDIKVTVPTMGENLKFFFNYQVNFMYWRYFLWNFVGRQNDIQNTSGDREHGNWITGISFLDNARLGDQAKLPTELKENRGRNVYYALPLLLGLLGLVWQVAKKGKGGDEGVKQFWIVFFLFFMTGLAIVVYLNQTPLQPRERDYAYAGSFYAFAIWCGMGVAAIADILKRLTHKELIASLAACTALLVPVQMASQNWDDHDRSGRYAARDFGFNYLNTLPEGKGAIIFTNGDNDTFPLWYAQETEGVRTDARVCNLSYLQTDWYIDQMRRPAYNSPGVPMTWPYESYRDGGDLDVLPIEPDLLDQFIQLYGLEAVKKEFGENPYDLKNIMEKWVLNPPSKDFRVIPTDHIEITIDKEAVRRSGMKIIGDTIPDKMEISLKGRRYLTKSDLAMYEMLLRCNWERPLYIAVTVGPSSFNGLNDYLVKEGLAYRITPFNVNGTGNETDSEKMYDNIMKRWKFGNISDPKVYLDETVTRMALTHRSQMSELTTQLVSEAREAAFDGDSITTESKMQKANLLLEKMEKEIPASKVPYTYYYYGNVDIAEMLFRLGQDNKALDVCDRLIKQNVEYINWYTAQEDAYAFKCLNECRARVRILYTVGQLMEYNLDEKVVDRRIKQIEEAINKVTALAEREEQYLPKDQQPTDFY